MCKNSRTRTVTPNVILIVTLVTAFIFYYEYRNRTAWNRDAIETKCLVTNHSIASRMCDYYCNCTAVCDMEDAQYQCFVFCQTCNHICYDGIINASYVVNEHLIYNNYVVVSGKNNSEIAQSILVKYYSTGNNTTCYFNRNNYTDSKIILDDYSSYYYTSAGIVVCGLLFSLCWSLTIIFMEYQKNKNVNFGEQISTYTILKN